jgi:hypothetical protein
MVGPFLENNAEGRGGYFVGKPEVQELDKYLMIDFSYEGELRVVEGRDLDDDSWGLYGIKKNESPNFRDGDGSLIMIQLAVQLFVLNRDTKIVWGDLASGTTLFLPDTTIELVLRYSSASEADIRDGVIPSNDPRFKCRRIDSYELPNGNTALDPGTECEFVGG